MCDLKKIIFYLNKIIIKHILINYNFIIFFYKIKLKLLLQFTEIMNYIYDSYFIPCLNY